MHGAGEVQARRSLVEDGYGIVVLQGSSSLAELDHRGANRQISRRLVLKKKVLLVGCGAQEVDSLGWEKEWGVR